MKFLTNKTKSNIGKKFKFRKTIFKQLNFLISKPYKSLLSNNFIEKLHVSKKGLPNKITFYFNREKFLKAETLIRFNDELSYILLKEFHNSVESTYFLAPIAPLTLKGLLCRMGGGKGKISTYYYKYAKNTLLVVINVSKILKRRSDYVKLYSMLSKLRNKYSYLSLHKTSH